MTIFEIAFPATGMCFNSSQGSVALQQRIRELDGPEGQKEGV